MELIGTPRSDMSLVAAVFPNPLLTYSRPTVYYESCIETIRYP